jgi:RND family efflux transporter MFP subunit
MVKVGDLLARLDDQDYVNKLRSAEADHASAQATVVESEAAEWRLRQLLTNGVTTRAAYDTALKNLRSAEAKRESAKASLELAKDQLAYAELRADFDGIVTAVKVDPGQVVNIGQAIVKVARRDDRDAVFTVAEAAFGDRTDDDERPEITVSLLSNPNISADGIVRERCWPIAAALPPAGSEHWGRLANPSSIGTTTRTMSQAAIDPAPARWSPARTMRQARGSVWVPPGAHHQK